MERGADIVSLRQLTDCEYMLCCKALIGKKAAETPFREWLETVSLIRDQADAIMIAPLINGPLLSRDLSFSQQICADCCFI